MSKLDDPEIKRSLFTHILKKSLSANNYIHKTKRAHTHIHTDNTINFFNHNILLNSSFLNAT